MATYENKAPKISKDGDYITIEVDSHNLTFAEWDFRRIWDMTDRMIPLIHNIVMSAKMDNLDPWANFPAFKDNIEKKTFKFRVD